MLYLTQFVQTCAGTHLLRTGHYTSTLLRWPTLAATCAWQQIRLGHTARGWIYKYMVGGTVDMSIQNTWLFELNLMNEFWNHPQTPKSPSNFMVSVPPSIADGRINVTVTVNVQTTLSCEATGIPKPAVSWMKNGRAINTDQNQNMYRLIQVFSLSVFSFKIKNSKTKFIWS